MCSIKFILVVHMGKEVTQRSFIVSELPKTVKEMTELLRSHDLRLETVDFEYTVHSMEVNRDKSVKFTSDAQMKIFFATHPKKVYFEVLLDERADVSTVLSPHLTDFDLVKLLIFPPLDSNALNAEVHVCEKTLIIPPVDIISALKRSVKSTMNSQTSVLSKADFSIFFVPYKDNEENHNMNTVPFGPVTDNDVAREWLVEHVKSGKAVKLTYKLLNQPKSTRSEGCVEQNGFEKGLSESNVDKPEKNINSKDAEVGKQKVLSDNTADDFFAAEGNCTDHNLSSSRSVSKSSTARAAPYVITVLVSYLNGSAKKIDYTFSKASPNVLVDFQKAIAESLSLPFPVTIAVRAGEENLVLDNADQLREWMALSREAGRPLSVRVSLAEPSTTQVSSSAESCKTEGPSFVKMKTNNAAKFTPDNSKNSKTHSFPPHESFMVKSSITSTSPTSVHETLQLFPESKITVENNSMSDEKNVCSQAQGISSEIGASKQGVTPNEPQVLSSRFSKSIRKEGDPAHTLGEALETSLPKSQSAASGSFTTAFPTPLLQSAEFTVGSHKEPANLPPQKRSLKSSENVKKVPTSELAQPSMENCDAKKSTKGGGATQRPSSKTPNQRMFHFPASCAILLPISHEHFLFQSVFRWGEREQVILCHLYPGFGLDNLKKYICEAFQIQPVSLPTWSKAPTRAYVDVKLFISCLIHEDGKTQRIEVVTEEDFWKQCSTSVNLTNVIWEIETPNIDTANSTERDDSVRVHDRSSFEKEAGTTILLDYLAKSIQFLSGGDVTVVELQDLLGLCDVSVNGVVADSTPSESGTLFSVTNRGEKIATFSTLLEKLRDHFSVGREGKKSPEDVLARLSHACAVIYAKRLATPRTVLHGFFSEISEFIEKINNYRSKPDVLVQIVLHCGKERQFSRNFDSLSCNAFSDDASESIGSVSKSSSESFARECVKHFENEPAALLDGLALFALKNNVVSYLCADTMRICVHGNTPTSASSPNCITTFQKPLVNILRRRLQRYLDGETGLTRQKVETFVQQCGDKLPVRDARDELLNVLGILLASRPVSDYTRWFQSHFRGKFSQITFTQMFLFTFTEALPTDMLYKACWTMLKPELDPVVLSKKYSTVAGALASWAFTALQLQCLYRGIIHFPPFPMFNIALTTAVRLSRELPSDSTLSHSQINLSEPVEMHKVKGDTPPQLQRSLLNVNNLKNAKKNDSTRKKIVYRYIYTVKSSSDESLTG